MNLDLPLFSLTSLHLSSSAATKIVSQRTCCYINHSLLPSRSVQDNMSLLRLLLLLLLLTRVLLQIKYTSRNNSHVGCVRHTKYHFIVKDNYTLNHLTAFNSLTQRLLKAHSISNLTATVVRNSLHASTHNLCKLKDQPNRIKHQVLIGSCWRAAELTQAPGLQSSCPTIMESSDSMCDNGCDDDTPLKQVVQLCSLLAGKGLQFDISVRIKNSFVFSLKSEKFGPSQGTRRSPSYARRQERRKLLRKKSDVFPEEPMESRETNNDCSLDLSPNPD